MKTVHRMTRYWCNSYAWWWFRNSYILKVDPSTYCNHRQSHDGHNDLPLAPEHRVPSWLKELKLVTTMYYKGRYVLHYRNLELYLSPSMRLKDIHLIPSINQSDYLKKYIDLNTQLRTQAKIISRRICIDSWTTVFGKTIGNTQNRVDIRLCT